MRCEAARGSGWCSTCWRHAGEAGLCAVSTERKHGAGDKAGAHLCLHQSLLLETSTESDRGACGRWAPRSTIPSPQHAAGSCRDVSHHARPAARPVARGDNAASPGAAGWRLEPARQPRQQHRPPQRRPLLRDHSRGRPLVRDDRNQHPPMTEVTGGSTGPPRGCERGSP